MTSARPIVLMLTVTGLMLAGCGKMGELERPAPRSMTNERNAPSPYGSVRENVDPATSEATIRQARLPGSGSDPFGGASGPGFPGSGTR